jgi:hypothetical protein
MDLLAAVLAFGTVFAAPPSFTQRSGTSQPEMTTPQSGSSVGKASDHDGHTTREGKRKKLRHLRSGLLDGRSAIPRTRAIGRQAGGRTDRGHLAVGRRRPVVVDGQQAMAVARICFDQSRRFVRQRN